MNKKGLGKGLEALLSIYDNDDDNNIETNNKINNIQENKEGVFELPIEKIKANPNQPRKNFNENALAELSESIKQHGVIQPIVVNNNNDGSYMIIAGERRYRASKIAGLEKIPCVVKQYTERQIKEISIVENLQREDLNPIEAAKAIKQLMTEYKFTQEVIADRIGKSRPNVTNLLRLLTLTPEVIEMVENGILSAGHARALIVVENPNKQIKYANLVVDKGLSVRDLENILKQESKVKIKKEKIIDKSEELENFTEELERTFATKVTIIGNDNKGKICIDYFSKDDLDRIYDLVQLIKNKKLTLADLSNYNKKV